MKARNNVVSQNLNPMTNSESQRSETLRFTSEHVSAFAAASHDCNPLHCDPEYSRSTQFGRPVVHGVCGLLAMLGAWAQGRGFILVSIRARFEKSLFVGETYTAQIHESLDGRVKIQLLKGFQVHVQATFVWRKPEVSQKFLPQREQRFRRAKTARDWNAGLDVSKWLPDPFPYEPDWDALRVMERNFSLSAAQFPFGQVCALLWSSYFIGMEIPGKQALFVELNFIFEIGNHDANGFELGGFRFDHDTRYNSLTVSGHGTGISSFQLRALRRPEPVRFGIESVRKVIGESQDLAGKTVFISGASRGFGAVLARSFALHGANLALNHRASLAEARELELELRQMGREIVSVSGDVGLEEDCQRIREQLLLKFKQLDFLICNASPQIGHGLFLAQTPSEFMGFVQHSIQVNSQILHSLLPLLNPGAKVVFISTIFTVTPQKQFSHYVTAKSAVEGLVRALAHEFESLTFLIARPPRMLTDQTNLAFDPHPPVSPVEVARRLMETLRGLDSGRNLFEVNL